MQVADEGAGEVDRDFGLAEETRIARAGGSDQLDCVSGELFGEFTEERIGIEVARFGGHQWFEVAVRAEDFRDVVEHRSDGVRRRESDIQSG